MLPSIRPSFALIAVVLLALLAVEIPARVVEDVVIDPSMVSAIAEPMVRQARQQSTATVTVLKTVLRSIIVILIRNWIWNYLVFIDDPLVRHDHRPDHQENLRHHSFRLGWYGQSRWHYHIYQRSGCSLQPPEASVLGPACLCRPEERRRHQLAVLPIESHPSFEVIIQNLAREIQIDQNCIFIVSSRRCCHSSATPTTRALNWWRNHPSFFRRSTSRRITSAWPAHYSGSTVSSLPSCLAFWRPQPPRRRPSPLTRPLLYPRRSLAPPAITSSELAIRLASPLANRFDR